MEFGQLFSYVVFVLSITLGVLAAEEIVKDTREGENVSLECRFPPQATGQATYFWQRINKFKQDNVAIQDTPLNVNYRLDFRPKQGQYDLLISNASYARDDGKFECSVKAAGSGKDLHTQSITLTVLTPPGPPVISPGPQPTATEGNPMELNCSSHGGSPSPTIRWFRDGSNYPLVAETRSSMSRESITTSVLSLTPSMKDDGALYRCVVENRAMPEGAKLEAKVTLNVNYFPRVEVGPENPLRVERGGTATLECSVDSKPPVSNVQWTREDKRFISTDFTHKLHRVTLQEAGKYTCTANNGLSQQGVAHILLDVLYPPMVTIENGAGGSTNREVEEGEAVDIRCNVTSNPDPHIVEWVRESNPDFRQSGEVLRINSVSAEHAGAYTCRAVNSMTPSGQARRRVDRVGNATITLLVRHQPGKTSISPDKPVASEGTGVTLTCTANPPGWPAPVYRWWKETGESSSGKNVPILANGPKYTIPSAHLGNEGKYYCDASNALGVGTVAEVMLEVHQQPKLLTKLQGHVTRKIEDVEFSVTCKAQGKPLPTVKWLKDGYVLTPDSKTIEISTDESAGRNSVYTVQSSLRFRGESRPGGNQLMASDRGVYSCVFENEVKPVESTMHLKIEHKPIVLIRYNKVAYDVHETAEIVCRVQAYPRPVFSWSYGTNAAPLQGSSEGHYEIITTPDSGDIFRSVLKIANIREVDYGDYTCKVDNSRGKAEAVLKLQKKGQPDHPITVSALNVGPNFVTLEWEPGFDGGLPNTKFFVSYRRVPGNVEDALLGDCGGYENAKRISGEQEFDCQRNNPCNVTSLDQHYSYTFKVKAFNTLGNSNYSDEVTATTKVDRIPAPQRVTYDPETHQLSINTAATCLQLIGFVEATLDSDDEEPQWRLIETLPMMGGSATRREATILSLVGRNKEGGRSMGDDEFRERTITAHHNPRVRVKFCLRQEQEHCSEPVEAEIGPSYIKDASVLTTPTLIAIIVSCIVFVLFVGLMYMFCRCKRGRSKKGKGKDYEVEQSVRPSLVTQAPPPYYPAPGLENQAMERSMDLETSGKPPLYGYHGSPPQSQQHNPNGGEWVNMGYMDNSYSNSNNGGSVNSQDSLWQMKMAAAAAGGVASDSHHLSDRYGYDPVTHGGYGTAVDDYAPYPHLDHNNAPSRQDYNMSDPYAAVHKPKKRFDQHLDSPYHDVSGLPDPYMDQMDCDESKPQHISLSFDESLESGYSTPNSRNRRVIREIIV